MKVVGLLLLALRLQVLVGAKGQRAADQDDGVQADARRGAVGGRGGGAGLCVALGLGVALLFRLVSLLSFSVVGIGLWGWCGVRVRVCVGVCLSRGRNGGGMVPRPGSPRC